MSGGFQPELTPSPAYFRQEADSFVCELCPYACVLKESQTGRCGVRTVTNGRPNLPGWGYITAASSDPIEKKPLYHFFPGEPVWSIGFNGCNLHCPFCQNESIAKPGRIRGKFVSPKQVIQETIDSGSKLLAYTYSEPTVHIEYILETSKLAHEAGILNILVTNGNLQKLPSLDLLESMDAVNVDLKSWDETYYRKVLGGSLSTTLDFIEAALKLTWVEITTLVVPGDNDSPKSIGGISRWISDRSREIPLHLSAYYPAGSYIRSATSVETMQDMSEIASENLNYVYLGNLGLENDTICPHCGVSVIRRKHYATSTRLISGACPECGAVIPGRFAK